MHARRAGLVTQDAVKTPVEGTGHDRQAEFTQSEHRDLSAHNSQLAVQEQRVQHVLLHTPTHTHTTNPPVLYFSITQTCTDSTCILCLVALIQKVLDRLLAVLCS